MKGSELSVQNGLKWEGNVQRKLWISKELGMGGGTDGMDPSFEFQKMSRAGASATEWKLMCDQLTVCFLPAGCSLSLMKRK